MSFGSLEPAFGAAATLHDKKVAAKRVRWVLLEDFGRPVVRDDVPDEAVRDGAADILT